MNEFTKDELLIIHLDMCTYVEQNKILKESPSHKELRHKIEKMIDNYCEHEWEKRYDVSEYDECKKCGECEL